MKKSWLALLSLALISIPIICCLLGLIPAWALFNGVFRSWDSLGAPPDPIVEILDADASVVYVKTAQGDIYRDRGCPECWEKAQLLDAPLLDPDFKCPPMEARSPSPPGQVINQVDGTKCYADGATYFRYVLLEDGELWYWSYTNSVYGLFIYPIFGAAGCLAGAALAVIILVMVVVYSSNKTRNVNN